MKHRGAKEAQRNSNPKQVKIGVSGRDPKWRRDGSLGLFYRDLGGSGLSLV